MQSPIARQLGSLLPQQAHPVARVHKRLTSRLSALSLALVIAGLSHNALAIGKLEGQIRDNSSQQPLAGATVTLKEINLSQQAGRDGRFFFVGVQDGDYTLVVNYLGAMPTEHRISIRDKQTTLQDINLNSQDVEHIRVVGQQGALSTLR